MRRRTAQIFLTAALLVISSAPVAATATPADTRPGSGAEAAVPAAGASGPTGTSIRQQGLTIFELDKELVRLKEQEASLNEQMEEQRSLIARQQVTLDARTAAAGRVLRAYYTGQRDRMWVLLFRMGSLNEALLALDYLQAIVRNDFRTLRMYREALEGHRQLVAGLEAQQAEVVQLIAAYEQQRERLLAEQAELDRQLALLTEEEQQEELEQIEKLTLDWQNLGIPVFEEVLSALSAAMVDLPELLSDESLFSLSGTSVQVRIPDDHFNSFLQSRNPLFERFRFAFRKEGLVVSGEVQGKPASFSGQFILETEPVNALRFEIRSILFDHYELPDTTQAALQQQYDLTFEPGKLLAGLVVSEIANEDGELRVKLAFGSFSLLSRN